jgi:hypothetical protein
MKQDIDIIAYALRKAIADQKVAAEHRKREGNIDAENGCYARLTRLRAALNTVDEMGAVDAA